METMVLITLAVLRIIFLALAISTYTIFIAKSLMMEPVRNAIDRKHPWIGFAIKCTHCEIGWTSLVLVALYKPYILSVLFNSGFWPIDYVVSSTALWGLGTFIYKVTWPFLEKNAPKMRVVWSRH
jgi:hypothetical protein